MPKPEGRERRRILSNGTEEATFRNLDSAEQNWVLYGHIHTLGNFLEDFLDREYGPMTKDVGKLKSFIGKFKIALYVSAGIVTGMGAFNHEKLVSTIMKIIV